MDKAVVTTHPSLALVKYWGKADDQDNIPATPSVAVSLSDLSTTTEVSVTEDRNDRVWIDEKEQNPERMEAFFASLRSWADQRSPGILQGRALHARSTSDFPTASGLASSASGFAALILASVAALDLKASLEELSALARIGSASAARSVFGGVVLLDAGAHSAVQILDEDWWPELGVLVVQTTGSPKSISSRKAMERCRRSSPYYESWVHDAPHIAREAIKALETRDLPTLGPLMRVSYMRMFSTMFSADPPLLYWNPQSVAAIELCQNLRDQGFQAWETMDAGPQVKVFCLTEERDSIGRELQKGLPGCAIRYTRVGAGPVHHQGIS